MSISATPAVRTGAGFGRRWAALAVLMLPVLLVAVDNTVLAFAVPMISEALRPTGVELLWIVDVYPLVLAACWCRWAASVTGSAAGGCC